MNIELLGQFSQRLLTPYGSQSHLRLECRRMVPAWSFAHRLSCSAAILAAVRQKRHLSNLSKNPEPALRKSRCDQRPNVERIALVKRSSPRCAGPQGHRSNLNTPTPVCTHPPPTR